ncbi:hypothetical protein EW146_g4236 [Bondarzewia mesenterica]|uniref:Glycolipid transfer protein domain-containing protein n=1 Tax=Bondarzewia mesenterica TaxID=1095465 RepID=A0A4S4LV64_9AGAM|nr:hypothetical protein EW146_g4236 [Bondarzewia mesenterica]
MAPQFETVKACTPRLCYPSILTFSEQSFAEVPIHDDGVDTAAFLEASDGLVDIFGNVTPLFIQHCSQFVTAFATDLLGSGVFGFVQTDLRNNITGVRKRFESRTNESPTLEKLVIIEADEGQKHGTACLVRLIRGLAFTCRALQNAQNDTSAELHICFRRSYDTVLRHHHSFVIRSVVQLAIRAVPRRDDFYSRIAQGGSVDKLQAEMARWLVGDYVVKRIQHPGDDVLETKTGFIRLYPSYLLLNNSRILSSSVTSSIPADCVFEGIAEGLDLPPEQSEFAIKSSENNINGTSSPSGGGFVIDLIKLNKVQVREGGWEVVEGGAGDLWGAAVASGGHSNLNAFHGLGRDNIVEVTVALADGRIVKASSKEEPDLFGAIQGEHRASSICALELTVISQVGPVVLASCLNSCSVHDRIKGLLLSEPRCFSV